MLFTVKLGFLQTNHTALIVKPCIILLAYLTHDLLSTFKVLIGLCPAVLISRGWSSRWSSALRRGAPLKTLRSRWRPPLGSLWAGRMDLVFMFFPPPCCCSFLLLALSGTPIQTLAIRPLVNICVILVCFLFELVVWI